MKHCVAIVSAIAIASSVTIAPAQAPVRSPTELIARAIEALGGVAGLDSLRNKTIEFNTVTFALGQEETPSSPARATFVSGRITYDYLATRQLTLQEERPVIGGVNRLRRVTLARLSLSELNGTMQMDAATVPANIGRSLALEIDQILRFAARNPVWATAIRARTLRDETVDGVRIALGVDTVRVWFDRLTGLPVARETLIDDSILGDRRTVIWYTRWQPAGHVQLPRQVDVEVNGRLLTHTVITSATVNQALDESLFAIPDSMRARAPAFPPLAARITVNLTNLAPALWRAEGGSHHSLVIDQGQSLLVVEAPQSAARSAAVLDTLERRFPGRRVSAVVMTHHHHDHSGGIRAYMARGIPVYAHQRNVAFARGIAAARKTVAPDRLTRGAQAPAVSAVNDSTVIGRGPGRVILYTLPTIHAEGVLVAWHPASGTLFTSDVLSPAANQPPARTGSVEMVAFARSRGLSPMWFAGGHGTVVEWTAVSAAAAR
jgi:glyoxylase-like metal-dependent hydrolase (beta-lactamase superfamily II)